MGPTSWAHCLLELRVFSLSQLDLSLLKERPTLDRFKAVALVLLASKPASVKLYIRLWGRTGSFSRGILPCMLREKLLWSHFLCKMKGNAKNESKRAQWRLGVAAKGGSRKLVGGFWGRRWGENSFTPPFFKILIRHTRPGELIIYFFFQKILCKVVLFIVIFSL